MQFLAILAAAATLLASSVDAQANQVQALAKWPSVKYASGFNLGSDKPNGGCKNIDDWEKEFEVISGWGTHNANNPNSKEAAYKAKFNSIKIFSTNKCNGLDLAIQAAMRLRARRGITMKICAGLWPGINGVTFDEEKRALENVLKDKNKKIYLNSVVVASESLYRKDTSPRLLAQQIHDVKGMTQIAYKLSIPVGTADTWTAWVDGANNAVIQASDIIVVNAFPYWQGANADAQKSALKKFMQAISNVRGKTTKPIMIGETGWPTSGPNFGAAVPSVQGLKNYWSDAMCFLMKRDYPFFWFSGFDETFKTGVEKSFGLADANKKLKIGSARLDCRAYNF